MLIQDLKKLKADGDLLEKRGLPRTYGINEILPIEKDPKIAYQTKLKIEEHHLTALQDISEYLFKNPDHAGKILQDAIKTYHDKLDITPRMPENPTVWFVRRDIVAYEILKSNKNWIDVSAVTYSPWVTGFLDAWLEEYNKID